MQCGSAKDMIQLLRSRLLDSCESMRYDDPVYTNRINLALLNIYSARPDEFPQKVIEVPLKEGAEQFLPVGVTMFEFLGTGYKGSRGSVAPCPEQKKPQESSDEFLDIYKTRCAKIAPPSGSSVTLSDKCNGYSVSSYSYERKNGGFFTVSPNAPKDGGAVARFLVSECPQCKPENMDEQLPCKLWAAIFEKSAAYMLAIESEDAATTQKAAVHEGNFDRIMAAMYKTDSRIGSGYFRGQKPDGSSDPNVTR